MDNDRAGFVESGRDNYERIMKLLRTDSSHQDFQSLVVLLDKDLKIRDGDEHEFYAQHIKIDHIKNVVVAYIEDEPVGL